MLTLVDHPLVQHKLTLLRKAETPTAEFRRVLREISLLMAYEATRGLPLTMQPVETPLARFDAPVLAGKKVCFVSILRAGNGILDGMLDLVPAARVGHIGLYRDPGTLIPIEYYFKLPEDIGERDTIVVDPMIATGHSAIAAVDRLKEAGAKSIRFVCLLAAPEGIEKFHGHHPEVHIWTAAIDEKLNDHGYIVPGLGDAGDRMYGTK